MSQVPGIDKTVLLTLTWIRETCEALGVQDDRRGWRAILAVLHALRDRMLIEESADFASQLPMLVRGAFYEGWKPSRVPVTTRTKEAFLEAVLAQHEAADLDPEAECRAVFRVVAKHASPGEVEQVRNMLPPEIRALWPSGGGQVAPNREPTP